VIGKSIFIDHGTGVVIGETAVVEDGVSMLHGVTLGGTGKERGDRHPKVRRGVSLGAGAKVLGNIEIGACAKIAAGSVVLERLPAGLHGRRRAGAHHRLRRRSRAGTRDGSAHLDERLTSAVRDPRSIVGMNSATVGWM